MSNLFKITKNEKVNYLYGTCHMTSNSEICALSEEAKRVFEEANYVGVEMITEEQEKVPEHFILVLEEWKKQNGINSEELPSYLTYAQIKKIATLFMDQLPSPSHISLFKR